MRNQDLPLRAEFRGLPDVPEDQVVTGLIPHEPPHFQTPAALELLSSPICVLTGQRGVGKTQVAAAYARQRVHDGWLVAWIGAETEDQIRAGTVELADRLGLYRPEDSAEVTCARVRNHLQTRTGPALLVFDNVVSLDVVRPYLPSVGTVQVVITSTARGSQAGQEVPVDVFAPETAVRFLGAATGLDYDGAAAALAKELGYLPLALSQAAARIRAARWSYAKYLGAFRKFPAAKHLSRRDGDPYPLGAATAILMALEPFQRIALVETLAVLSPDGVSRQLLGDAADDELVLLREASLVEFAGDSAVIMHRLVQRVIRDRSRDSSCQALLRAAKLLYTPNRPDDEPWARRHLVNEHARQSEALMANLGPGTTREVIETVLAIRLRNAHDVAEIADLARAGLIAAEVHDAAVTLLGEQHQLAATALQLVGLVMPSDMVRENLELNLARFRDEFGLEHSQTQAAANVLSNQYLVLGLADEALAVLHEVLEPWRDRPRLTVPAFATAEALARAYLATGRAAEAVATLEQVVQDETHVYGAESRTTLMTTSMLADAYEAAGRSDEALKVREHVCDTSRRVLGLDHPFALICASQLGVALTKHGQTEEARTLLRETHALASQVLGERHWTTEFAQTALERIPQD